MKPSVPPERYQLVQLPNGTFSVHADAYGEKMHPGLGPAAEAEQLYIRQLRIRERMQQSLDEFVVWDVGLGAAANALTLLRLTRDLPCPLRIISFDDTSGPLEFALAHAEKLGYLHGYEAAVKDLLQARRIEFTDDAHTVKWEFNRCDFPTWLERSPTRRELEIAPNAIFFDAFSPAKNPAMWTLPLFQNLSQQLDPARPCSLTTYSRSTMLRVTLLLAGFFVGCGVATGLKEETTVAANSLALLEAPLAKSWLARVQRSDNAEPLQQPTYRKSAPTADTLRRLHAHPQFQ